MAYLLGNIKDQIFIKPVIRPAGPKKKDLRVTT